MSVLEQAKALAEQLNALKDAARAELAELRKRVAELEAIVGPEAAPFVATGVSALQQAAMITTGKPIDPISETDFGMRTPSDGGGNGNATLEEFKDELADLRLRTADRRARRA